MEFVAKLTDQITPGAVSATKSMLALKGIIVDVDKALKSLEGGGADGAAGALDGLADAGKAAGALAPSVDKYSAALGRLKEQFKGLSAVKKAGEVFDTLKDKAVGIKEKVEDAFSKAIDPLKDKLSAAKEKFGAFTDKIQDSKAYMTLSDIGTVATGAFGKAKDKLGAFTDKVKDSKAFQSFSSGVGKAGDGMKSMAGSAGSLLTKLAGIAVALASGAGGFALPFAIGYRNMAKLQGLSAQATRNFRGLFSGVNSDPLVRAYGRFLSLFSKSSKEGSALSDVFTRFFNGVFQWIEKVEPYAEAFVLGFEYGALKIDTAFTKARIGLLPFTSELEKLTGDQDLLTLAFDAGIAVATALAGVVETVATAFGLLASGISKVIGLYNDFTGAVATLQRIWGADSYWGPDKGKAGDDGWGSGAALGDGMAKGMRDKLGDVQKAGGELAKAADAGVKTTAQIHSPSRMMRENAQYMGEGVKLGLEDSAPVVQKTAGETLVPNLPSGGGGTGKSASRGDTTINIVIPNLTSGDPEKLKAALSDPSFIATLKQIVDSEGGPVN